jgi:phospholipid/cholesterol/gamma-HCH transport system ATP-binding protein
LENETVIELKNVLFTNDDYTVLENINLSIYKNTFTTIIGKSGAGKTSLLKLIAGIYYPDKGEVKIFSNNLNVLTSQEMISLRKKMGFVFQDSALISNLSIKENLMLPLSYHEYNISVKDKNEVILDALDKINLTDTLDQRPAQLSLGEQKLIAMARAMILKPEILFLDEPLAYLDELNMKKVLFLIEEYFKNHNATVIAVSNIKSIVNMLSERIILIDNKTILINDYVLEIKKSDRFALPELLNEIFYG